MSKTNDKGILFFALTMIVLGAISLPSYFAVKPVELYPLLPLSVSYSYMVFSGIMSFLGIVIGIGLLRKSEKARKAGVSVFLAWLAIEIPFFFISYVNSKQRTSINGSPELVYPVFVAEIIFNLMFMLFCVAFIYYATRDKVKVQFQLKDDKPESTVQITPAKPVKESTVNRPFGIQLISGFFVLVGLFSLFLVFIGSVMPYATISLSEKEKIEILKREKIKGLNIRTIEELDDYMRKASKGIRKKAGSTLFNMGIYALIAVGIWKFKNWARLAAILITLMTAIKFFKNPLLFSIPFSILFFSLIYLYSPPANKMFSRK